MRDLLHLPKRFHIGIRFSSDEDVLLVGLGSRGLGDEIRGLGGGRN